MQHLCPLCTQLSKPRALHPSILAWPSLDSSARLCGQYMAGYACLPNTSHAKYIAFRLLSLLNTSHAKYITFRLRYLLNTSHSKYITFSLHYLLNLWTPAPGCFILVAVTCVSNFLQSLRVTAYNNFGVCLLSMTVAYLSFCSFKKEFCMSTASCIMFV